MAKAGSKFTLQEYEQVISGSHMRLRKATTTSDLQICGICFAPFLIFGAIFNEPYPWNLMLVTVAVIVAVISYLSMATATIVLIPGDPNVYIKVETRKFGTRCYRIPRSAVRVVVAGKGKKTIEKGVMFDKVVKVFAVELKCPGWRTYSMSDPIDQASAEELRWNLEQILNEREKLTMDHRAIARLVPGYEAHVTWPPQSPGFDFFAGQ